MDFRLFSICTLKQRGCALLKFILLVLWCIWGWGINATFLEKTAPLPRNVQRDEAAREELRLLRNAIRKKAEAKGINYGLADYFADRQTMVRELKRLNHPERFSLGDDSGHIRRWEGTLSERARENAGCSGKLSSMRHRAAVIQEYSRRNSEFESWRARYDPYVPTPFQRYLSASVRQLGPRDILAWYLKTLLLFALLVLIRIWERDGRVWATLERRPWYALAMICLWPIGFFRYPYEVWREVRVRAEIRRRKRGWPGLFAQLTREEEQVAQRVAKDHEQYHTWIHVQQGQTAYHGLIAAVLATLFLLLVPLEIHARGAPECCSNGISQTISASVDSAHELPPVCIDVGLPPVPWRFVLPIWGRCSMPPKRIGVERTGGKPPKPIPLLSTVRRLINVLCLGEENESCFA